MAVIKSVYDNQNDILIAILHLLGINSFDADISYGNGQFYKEIQKPKYRFDIDATLSDVEIASSVDIPLESGSLSSIVFDPPFLTYVRGNRSGNGNMIMSNRFSGYWKYSELQDHYIQTLKECSRLLSKNGVVVFKCQDIIHNHKMHPTHINVIKWAEDFNFRLKDLFILSAKHRLPSPNRNGIQKHARIFHSYFLILEKVK